MNFKKGQGVWGKIRFVDGAMPLYPRPYLVIEVYSDHIDVLNVSSIQGKEYKLLYLSNEELKVYDPPFRKPSFVKLDSRISVPMTDYGNLRILHNGDPLNTAEFLRIYSRYKNYNHIPKP